jgi:hypothetical protein
VVRMLTSWEMALSGLNEDKVRYIDITTELNARFPSTLLRFGFKSRTERSNW